MAPQPFVLPPGIEIVSSVRVSEPIRPERLISLDVLRGLDMAMIIGLGAALQGLAVSCGWTELAKQFDHVPWIGFHLEDLIFPLFIFIAGISLTYSLPRTRTELGASAAAIRLTKRCLILFFLGIFASKGLSNGWENVRWLGVLQRIALASLGAGLLFLFCKPRTLIAATITLLLGYWFIFHLFHTGDAATRYVEGKNVVNLFDAQWLPGRKYDGTHDPEGILSTFPAIATALLGVLAGQWVQSPASKVRKAASLAIAGVILLALGWIWHLEFPVIKKLWTSSFVLVAAGWSCLLFALCFWIVEIRQWRAWTPPWLWIGMNPITLYLVAGFVSFNGLAARLTGPAPASAPWLIPTAAFLLILLLARFLYRRKIFIRV